MASNRNIFLLCLAAAAVLLALPFGLPLVGVGVDGDDLSRDVADTAGVPWWAGSLSLLGLAMWAAAAAVCALAAAAVSDRQPERSRFLVATTALLLLAALDDALQLHETVGPEELGLPEHVVYAMLGAAAVLWGLRFRSQILSTRVWLLAIVVVFFAGTVLSDVLVIGPTAAEDWLKNSGIAVLLIWCADTALIAVRSEMTPKDPSEPRPTHAPEAATPPPAR